MAFSWWQLRAVRGPKAAAKTRRPARPAFNLVQLEDRTTPTFLAAVTYGTGAYAGGTAVADYTGDGRADIAVIDTAGSVGVMVSTGNGTFQPNVSYPTANTGYDLTAGDLNGDGKIDLVVAGSNVSVLLGNGDGTFGTPAVVAAGINAHAVKVGDFNNDGKADVGIMNPGTAAAFLGNGDGTFQAPLLAQMVGNSINLVLGDFNRDGNLDMATSNTVSVGTVNVLTGRGDGTFNPYASYYAFSAPVYLASGDFNHDGYDDFACPNSYAQTSMSVLLNNGDGTFAPPHTYDIPQTGMEIEVADFNGDGNQDYAVRGATAYMIALGKGDGTFYPVVTTAAPVGRFEAGTHGDFNGDGAPDFAYPTTAGVTVVMNAKDDVTNLAGAVGFAVAAPASTTAGSALPMTVTAVDAAGNPAPGFRGTVYLTSSDAAANAGTAYTFTAADAGVHAFAGTVRLVTPGTQTVTASAPFLSAASTPVNVTPAVARFAVSAPAATLAGDAFTVTVSAVDATGAVGTAYTSTVHFSTTAALAGLPADYTFTPADAGTHTFTASLQTAGAVTLTATEVAGTVSGFANVAVAPAAAAGFSLAGGSGAIGVARPVTVAARDRFGNPTPAYAGTAHFTSSDARAVLPADAVLASGTATVNVTFLTVGTQTVTATDPATGLTGTLSSDATPPVPAVFAITGFADTVAGVAKTFTLTVRDTIGQVATGYTGTVLFTSPDVQAGLPGAYTFTAADAGVHTFTATLKTAGAQAIMARDVAGTLAGTQAGIAVSPAAFAGFRLSVPNGTDSRGHVLLTAGEAVSLAVRAVDAFGNAAASYKGKVKFGSTDALAGLPADYTFTAADAGTHTFAVSLKTATANGVVASFTAVDSGNASTLATITNFEVSNATAASFALSPPSNVTAGTPFALKLTVSDAYGNKVKNYFGTVHFTDSVAAGGLPADSAFTATDAGVHTFTVTLTTTGTQTLTAADVANPLAKGSVVISVKAAGGGGGGGGGSGGGGGH